MSKLKIFKVRHPVYTLYTKDGEVCMRLHVVYGRLLPETKLRRNTWINGVSSGQLRPIAMDLKNFNLDCKSNVASWVDSYKAVRVVKCILEMEYEGYVSE